MHIERTRYIIRRKSDGALMCGLARNFKFKKESEICDTAIKTYVSKQKALAAAWSSYRYTEDDVYAEKVVETISSFEGGEIND